MTIYSIQRDWGPNAALVRIVTPDNIEDIVAQDWLFDNEADIERVNNGPFEWDKTDAVYICIVDSDGESTYQAIFNVFPDRRSLNPNIPLYPNLQNITAHAGGGQALATQLNNGINVVSVVATAADSVKLPDDVLGQTVIVVNTGANSLNIYPFLGDNIDALGTNNPYALGVQKTVVFYGVTVFDWRSILSA